MSEHAAKTPPAHVRMQQQLADHEQRLAYVEAGLPRIEEVQGETIAFAVVLRELKDEVAGLRQDFVNLKAAVLELLADMRRRP